MSDINYYGKSIYYVITYIVLVAAIILIVDEIVRMTIFCYNYNYNYNYGKISENLCKNDENTGIVEYEKARYKIMSSLNKYKFEKDLFNKNWINYLSYLIVIIFTILAIISFGILFYYYYIHNVQNCIAEPQEQDMSIIKLLIKCMFGDLHRLIPNCMIDYSLLLILVIIYPLIILLKSFFNIDFTWNSGFWSKAFHISISIILFLYVFKLLREKMDIIKDGNSVPVPLKTKYIKILIYLAFMGIFYLAQYIHLYSYNNYNLQLTASDIYNNPDDKNDTMFFDVYKQTKPLKPKKPDILKDDKLLAHDGKTDLLVSFKYCTETELTTAPFPTQCLGGSKPSYTINLERIENYYKTKKEYDDIMKKYLNKYNIYKNNNITFPEILTVFQGIVPKFLGFDNNIYIFIYVMIAVFVLIYGVIKFFESDYCDFYYNTVIIYLIGLITIFILTNAILTFNTYFNKYHIYEPISNYKYDIFKMNLLFDLSIINHGTLDTINNNKKKLYAEIYGSDKKFYDDTLTASDGTPNENIDIIINEIIKYNKSYNTQDLISRKSKAISLTIPEVGDANFNNNLNLFKLYNAIHIGLFSELLYLYDINKDIYTNIYISDTIEGKFFWNNTLTTNLYTKFYFYYSKPAADFYIINPSNIEDASKNLTSDFYTFIQIIKGTAVNNVNTIDNKIKRVMDNIEYLVYENYQEIINSGSGSSSSENSIVNQRLLLHKTSATPATSATHNLYKTFLLKENKVKENLGNDFLNKISSEVNIIQTYKYNLGILSQIGYYYSEFLLKMRDIVIKLFNSSSVYCDSQTVDINIFSKLNEYLNNMTMGAMDKRRFKTVNEESKIELYKKILKVAIGEFNDLYFRYFNIIKILIFNKIEYFHDTNNISDSLFNEVKSIYNIHADDEKKYNDNLFINSYSIKLEKDGFLNKYKKLTTKQKELIAYNTDSVSWGFVVLVIIFAVILLEPTII
jgi:hypothetical protein